MAEPDDGAHRDQPGPDAGRPTTAGRRRAPLLLVAILVVIVLVFLFIYLVARTGA
jgi:hypothetical protein